MLKGPKQIEWKAYGVKLSNFTQSMSKGSNYVVFIGQFSINTMVFPSLLQHEVGTFP